MSNQLEVQLAADTSQYQAGITQAVSLTAQQMRTLANYVKAANDSQAALGRGAQQAAAQASTAYRQVSEGAKHVAEGHAGITRELLVMTHELSQGNFKNLGGSALVLAERIDLLKYATSAAGVATLAFVAALAGVGVLVAKGAIEAEHFAKSLQLTANFAGVTADSLDDMAKSIATSTPATIGAAKQALEGLVASGRFGPNTIEQAARVATEVQRFTGQTSEEVVKDFARMGDGVARWAEEHDRQMHFLSASQLDYIRQLEQQGHTEEAALATLRAMDAQLTTSATMWDRVKQSVSGFADQLERIGKPTTLGDQIEKQQKIVDELKTGLSGATFNPFAGALPFNTGGKYAEAVDLLNRLRESQALAARVAKDQAEHDATQDAAKRAKVYTDEVLKNAKALSARTQELDKWDASVKALAAAGTPMSPAEQKAGRADIIKRFTPPDLTKQSNEYANLTATVKAFNDTTDQETAGLAKLTDGQKFVIQVQEQLVKGGKQLSDQQRAHILDLAQTAARARDVADAELRAQKATLARIQADTGNAQSQQGLVDSVLQAGNDQANALLHKARLIGLTADEALKAAELQRFDDLLGKALLGADQSTVQRIQEVAKVLRGNLVQAIDGVKAAQDKWNASFENGFGQAFQEYAKQAANSAQAGAQVFTDGVNGMTDAIVGFAQTGKLSFHSLVDSMISDLIRMQTQKAFVSLFGNGAGGALFDSAAGSAVASAVDFFPTFANGLDYVPYDGFTATLHEGERVLTKQDAATDRSSRGGAHFDNSVRIGSVGAGVSRAEVHAAVTQAQAAGEARMRRLLRNGSMVTA